MKQNKIVYGLEQVYIAFEDSTSGTYKSPVEIPGAVRLTTTATSERVDFYADNMAYYSIEANNGYTGNLEMALFPDSIIATMLGWEVDDTNGMLVEVADAKPTRFALMGQVMGDAKERRFVYYNVTAGRPNDDLGTKGETVEPKTTSLPIVIRPIKLNGKNVVKGVIEKNGVNDAIFDGFYSAVLKPGAAATPLNTASLDAVIDLGDSLEPTDYADPSKSEFTSALAAAKLVQGNPENQKEINDADQRLRSAILGLVPA